MAVANPELKERVDKLESVSGISPCWMTEDFSCGLMRISPDRRGPDQSSGNGEASVSGRFSDCKKFGRVFAPCKLARWIHPRS